MKWLLGTYTMRYNRRQCSVWRGGGLIPLILWAVAGLVLISRLSDRVLNVETWHIVGFILVYVGAGSLLLAALSLDYLHCPVCFSWLAWLGKIKQFSLSLAHVGACRDAALSGNRVVRRRHFSDEGIPLTVQPVGFPELSWRKLLNFQC